MQFLKTEILQGIQMLAALRLRNTPAIDTLPTVAKIWLHVFESRPINWDETLDKSRLRAMFTECAANCDEFPSPAHAFKIMPARIHKLSLPKPQTNEMSAENRKVLDDLLVQLNRKMVR
jgi:hypothetical protein